MQVALLHDCLSLNLNVLCYMDAKDSSYSAYFFFSVLFQMPGIEGLGFVADTEVCSVIFASKSFWQAGVFVWFAEQNVNKEFLI